MQQQAKLIDVRFHGRAGQGVVTASRFLAEAAISEGKWVHAFPNFGPERSGAPVSAYTRISEKRFYVKTEVTQPDYVVIIDPTLVPDLKYYKGIKPGGKVILNTSEVPQNVKDHLKDVEIWYVDGNKISYEYLKRFIANTVMLGSLVKATGVVQLESLFQPLMTKFKGELGEKNKQAITKAYEEVKKLE